MSAGTHSRMVLFEPWSLGDVIIAASALRELTTPAAIACHPQWHTIVRDALAERPDLELIPVDLPYTTRTRSNPFDSQRERNVPIRDDFNLVLSIRGDGRDYATARKMFPTARIRMNGWVRFLGRKSGLINAPYALGLCPVQNRYRSWAALMGILFSQIEGTYRRLQANAPASGVVMIHVGAQWRSKQFPHVAQLQSELEARGWRVRMLAGPIDRLPDGIAEAAVTRAAGVELVAQLRAAEHVITNDSGPMHLAAFLGCRTTALVRTSPIEEWQPPATRIIASPKTPRGYRPHSRYMSDEILTDWPSVETIGERFGRPRASAQDRGHLSAAPG